MQTTTQPHKAVASLEGFVVFMIFITTFSAGIGMTGFIQAPVLFIGVAMLATLNRKVTLVFLVIVAIVSSQGCLVWLHHHYRNSDFFVMHFASMIATVTACASGYNIAPHIGWIRRFIAHIKSEDRRV